MSTVFREFIRKIGSGTHTHQDLTRAESAVALRMMLTGEATPAQIGAFLIAHRIKRPTPAELAGMLDTYETMAERIPLLGIPDRQVVVLSQPYDGRDRTLPLSLVTALVLASAGVAVVQHGGDRLPTKEGVPLIELWLALGVDWRGRSVDFVHDCLEKLGIGFAYMNDRFPLAHQLVTYREQIGKRPPLATIELMWSPYGGTHHVMAGFVHPPTETMMKEAWILRGNRNFTTIKGLEGSCDLPIDRTAIVGLGGERLLLRPADYGVAGSNVPWRDMSEATAQITDLLQGTKNQLWHSALWNCGFYLWRSGQTETISDGMGLAQDILLQRRAYDLLLKLRSSLASSPQGKSIMFL